MSHTSKSTVALATAVGYVRTRTVLPNGTRRTTLEKPLVGGAGALGFVARAIGESPTSATTADTNAALSLERGIRAYRYGVSTADNQDHLGNTLTADLH